MKLIQAASVLIVLSLFPCQASWGDPEAPKPDSASEEKLPPTDNSPHPKHITVQVGTYTTLRKAALMRSILKEIGSVQVERIRSGDRSGDRATDKDTLYRVLIGEFNSIEEANHFIKTHRMNDLFKGVWVNSISTENPQDSNRGEIIPPDILEQDPYVVNIDLLCENGRKYGEYRATLQPDIKNDNQDIDLRIHWSCIPNKTERWLAKDELRSPSHFSLSALIGGGSLSMSDTTLGVMNRTDLSYGFQLTGFRSFGGMGPTFEYRMINHRYSGDAGTMSPLFYLAHRFLVGARLPLTHRIEFQPFFGFYTEAFLQGPTVGTATLVDPFLVQTGMRVSYHIIELEPRAWFDLIGGYHYLFPATPSGFALNSGSEWNFKLQASSFFPDNWGVSWFLEFSSRTLSSATFTQSDSLFLVGVSALLGF